LYIDRLHLRTLILIRLLSDKIGALDQGCDIIGLTMNQLPQRFGGFMTVAKSLKEPQSLRLDISNANLNITPEQFERLCADNPDLNLELTQDGQLILIPPIIADDQIETPIEENQIVNDSDVKYNFPELNPEEIARRVAAVEKFTERKRQLWNAMTPEERTEHDKQFEELYQLLEESRR
jgi:hypothetical protein